MAKKWRNEPARRLINRAIYEKDLPNLIEAMKEDNLTANITHNGIEWYHADYRITKTSIMDVWGLTAGQMERVQNYVYGHDPF
tara:strand:+ start:1160 stop:1408 length:249 start_codon:yes stop_codon:yes gene_type:complete